MAPGHPGTRGPESGYVLAVYGPDHPDSIGKATVECDVVLEDGHRTILTHVPVCIPGSSSPEICSTWRPNPVRRNIDTGLPLQFPTAVPLGIAGAMRYSPVLALVSDLSAMDGDRVKIDFIGGRVDRPVITQGMVHPRAAGGQLGGDLVVPWATDTIPHPMIPSGQALYQRRGGAQALIDEGGNIAIDTTLAPRGPDGGDPIPPQPVAGCVTLNLKQSASITLKWNNNPTVLRISHDGANILMEIGSVGATEPVILGNRFKTLFDGHTHLDSTGAATGPPQGPSLMSANPQVLSTKVHLDG